MNYEFGSEEFGEWVKGRKDDTGITNYQLPITNYQLRITNLGARSLENGK